MSIKLTEGGIVAFHVGKGFIGSILQVKEVIDIGYGKDVISLVLSDGKYFSRKFIFKTNGLLTAMENLSRFCIIRINSFQIGKGENKKRIEILNFDVIQKSTLESLLIGEPVEFNSVVGKADMLSFGYFPIRELNEFIPGKVTIRGRLIYQSIKLEYHSLWSSGYFQVYHLCDQDSEIRMFLFNGDPIKDIYGNELKTLGMYSVQNFAVRPAAYPSTVSNALEIVLNKNTVFERLENDKTILQNSFNFTSLPGLEKCNEDRKLFDVIGWCVGAYASEDIPGREVGEHSKRVIVICDESGLSVKVELWNNWAFAEDNNCPFVDKVIAIRGAYLIVDYGRMLGVSKTGYITIDPPVPRTKTITEWHNKKSPNPHSLRSISDIPQLEPCEKEDKEKCTFFEEICKVTAPIISNKVNTLFYGTRNYDEEVKEMMSSQSVIAEFENEDMDTIPMELFDEWDGAS